MLYYLADKERNMTEEKIYKKYIKEQCNNCKNKDKNDCEIRIRQSNNLIVTKCDYYEREN